MPLLRRSRLLLLLLLLLLGAVLAAQPCVPCIRTAAAVLCCAQLTKPPPVDEMLSWSVLTPCYEEDVLYPIHAETAAQALGLPPPPPPASGSGRMSDLLSETEDSVSLMAYLK